MKINAAALDGGIVVAGERIIGGSRSGGMMSNVEVVEDINNSG